MASSPVTIRAANPPVSFPPGYREWLETSVSGTLDVIEQEIPVFRPQNIKHHLIGLVKSLFVKTYSQAPELARNLFNIPVSKHPSLLIQVDPQEIDKIFQHDNEAGQWRLTFLDGMELQFLDRMQLQHLPEGPDKAILTKINSKIANLFKILNPSNNPQPKPESPAFANLRFIPSPEASDFGNEEIEPTPIQTLTKGCDVLSNVFNQNSAFGPYPLSPSSDKDFETIHAKLDAIKTALGEQYVNQCYYLTYLLKQDALKAFSLPDSVKGNEGRAILERWDEVTKTSPIPFSADDLEKIYNQIKTRYVLDQIANLVKSKHFECIAAALVFLPDGIKQQLFFSTWKTCQQKIEQGQYRPDANFGEKAWTQIVNGERLEIADYLGAIDLLRTKLAKPSDQRQSTEG